MIAQIRGRLSVKEPHRIVVDVNGVGYLLFIPLSTFYRLPEVPGEVIGKLHTGHFSAQGYLDLHGYTGDEVNETLDAFLAEAFQRDWKCVKVIHGRGLRSVKGPVLKDAVVRRLVGRYRKQVIAFVSARQCDGGLGAMYVLLRR